jgi:2-haloacid dehalogenase
MKNDTTLPSRRRLLTGAGAALLGASVLRSLEAQGASGVRAVLFDAFAIFDPKSMLAPIERLYPGQSAEFAAQFRRRLFEYTWLRTCAGRYRDFTGVSEDAARYAAATLKLELTARQCADIVAGFSAMQAYPDVEPGLQRLTSLGLRLGVLSNLTPSMLTSSLARAGLGRHFTYTLSTDRAQTYKPDPRAYALGTAATALRPHQILFVASAAWDATGAKWFGYHSHWLNRSSAPPEPLEAPPDATHPNFPTLLTSISNRGK